jgi:hypothetical protein
LKQRDPSTDGRNGRFLTSNVNITVEEDGKVIDVPIADRVAKFETKQYVHWSTSLTPGGAR